MATDWKGKAVYLARVSRSATFFFVSDATTKAGLERAAEHVFNEQEPGNGTSEVEKVETAKHLERLKQVCGFASSYAAVLTADGDPGTELDLDETFAAIEEANRPRPKVVQAKATRVETYDVEEARGPHNEPLLLLRDLPEGVSSLPEGLEYGGSYWVVRKREPKVVTYIQRGW